MNLPKSGENKENRIHPYRTIRPGPSARTIQSGQDLTARLGAKNLSYGRRTEPLIQANCS
jgi:hypothetical protein